MDGSEHLKFNEAEKRVIVQFKSLKECKNFFLLRFSKFVRTSEQVQELSKLIQKLSAVHHSENNY